jgi:quinoprotein glucose dehydrogenase
LDRPGPQRLVFPQEGTPYQVLLEVVVSPFGVPCAPPPWGTLLAVDLRSGRVAWEVPFGSVRDMTPLPIPWRVGLPHMGGPIATATGLVFIGAAMDDFLRAYDVETGAELWRGRLPAGGQATPMTYRLRPDARQFVVIAAGGHGTLGTSQGDWLVAFALPDSGR